MISVVVPIYNEQENLPALRARLTAALDSTGEPWELILVNDGSRDNSPQMMREMNQQDPRIKAVYLSRNFGHQPAITAGIHNAKGNCVVLIDGDLQDPPEVIPDMVKKWKDEGCQVVLAERRSRAEGGTRGIGFRLFYPVFRRISDLPTAPDAGIFGLMDRQVVDEFYKLPERNRFIPGLRSWLGFKHGSVFYDRQERAAGKPKQTLRRLVKYAFDGMLSFSYKPLRAATYMGMFMAAMTFVAALVYIAAYFFQTNPPPRGFTTTMMSILFLGSVQLISIGILGEYIGRIYEEIKQRPLYVVQEKLGIDD